MAGKHNVKCSNCDNTLYKRPSQLLKDKFSFCSLKCRDIVKGHKLNYIQCEFCHKDLKQSWAKQRFCNKSCSAKASRKSYNKENPAKNRQERIFNKLKEEFDFIGCMVIGCNYSKTYDLHRFVPGSEGGLYEIGNVFAICPNHHAEFHRKIIKFIKNLIVNWISWNYARVVIGPVANRKPTERSREFKSS